jgi:uncharacterized protein YcfJ
MKFGNLTAVALAVALTGCANIQQQTGLDNKTVSAAGGAAIGCVGGALLAKLTGQNAAAGCAVGAVAGGLIGFEKARQEEIAAAVQAQQDAIAALGPLPSGARIKAEPVKTVPVMVTDKTNNQTKAVDSFESFDLDIPLSMKGTPGYDKAIASLSAFAVKKADERGSSNIDRAMTAADARANKFVPETNVAKTPKGNPVTVTKVINNATQKGVERVTVRVRKLEPTAVS